MLDADGIRKRQRRLTRRGAERVGIRIKLVRVQRELEHAFVVPREGAIELVALAQLDDVLVPVVAQLERVMGELDRGPSGSGEGVAA